MSTRTHIRSQKPFLSHSEGDNKETRKTHCPSRIPQHTLAEDNTQPGQLASAPSTTPMQPNSKHPNQKHAPPPQTLHPTTPSFRTREATVSREIFAAKNFLYSSNSTKIKHMKYFQHTYYVQYFLKYLRSKIFAVDYHLSIS